MDTEAELIHEMERLWSPAKAPMLSLAEMKALGKAKGIQLVGRARCEPSLDRAAGRQRPGQAINVGVAQLVTRMRVLLERTRCAVADCVHRD